jgi:autotransporter-associated beta strand protein
MKKEGMPCVAIAVVLGWMTPLFGEQYFTDAGGPLAWDVTSANWGALPGGPYASLWTSSDAVFEGTAGIVNVDTVSANSIAFNVAGYVLTNGTVTLTGPMIIASNNATIYSSITGTVGLTKSGAVGTLTLGGTNTYSGGTTVSGGTLAVKADNQLGASGEGITLAGGTLRVNGSLNTITRPLTLGAGGGTISLGTYLNYNGAITGGTSLACSGSDFILGPPSPNNIGTLTMTGSRLFVNNANAIANNATLNITGGGMLVFQSSAAPTNPVNPMSFISGCGLGMRTSTAADLTLSTTNAAFPASGSFVFNNDDQNTRGITVNGYWPTLTGTLTLQVGGGTAPTVGAVTLNSVFSGAAGLTKTSPGTLVLAGTNSFTGGVSVDGGTLRLGTNSALGSTSATLTVKNGATLDLAGYSPAIKGLTDTLGFGALGTGLITNSGAAATLSITRSNMAFGGTIAGPISLVIPTGGSSYQILSGNSTYTGITTVFGSLEAWGTNALGSTSAGTVITNGAGLTLKGMSEPMVYAAEPLTFYGATQFSLNTDGTLRNATWTGPITLAAGSALTVTRGGFTNGSITVQSVITGSGSLNKDNATLALTLGGSNDYSGGTTLTAGLLKLAQTNALGTGSVAVNGGLLDLNGASATLGSLSGTAAGAIIDTSVGAGNTTLTINQSLNTTCSAPISNGVAKTVAFTKSGNGILTLSATNTFLGAVTVGGGTLKLGVAAAVPGNVVTVTSGGTLDLNAQNLNNGVRTVTVSGAGASGQVGALANTGASPEAQVFNLTLSNNAAIGTTGSKLNVYGTLKGNGFILTIAGTGETNIRLDNGLQNLGGVTVSQGLLRLESSQNWAGTYTVNAGAKLDSYGNRTEAGSVILNGGTLANGGGGACTWSGSVALAGTSAMDTTGGNMTLSGALTGVGGLKKLGSNTLTLSGAGGFGGALIVSNGTVTVNGSLTNANVTIASGATLNGSGTVHARIIEGVADTMVVNGTLSLAGLTLDLDVTGALSGRGPFTLVDATGGTLTGRFAAALDVPAGYCVAYKGSKVLLQSAGTLIRLY